jgi:hypothetical protein
MLRADRELDQRNNQARQVLLVRDVPITGDENAKSSLFRRTDQITIGQCLPTDTTRCDYFVRGKGAAQTKRRVLVEQDPDRHGVSGMRRWRPDPAARIGDDTPSAIGTQAIVNLVADFLEAGAAVIILENAFDEDATVPHNPST